jgi:hypothetical protein
MDQDRKTKMITKHSSKNTNRYPYINYISNIDIFDSAHQRITAGPNGSTVIIPHVCNNVNAFGAGFAGAIANKYPSVKENYHLLGNNMKLGHVQFISVKKDKTYDHEIIFANMIAQNGIIDSHKNPRPINYAALVQCMLSVKTYKQQLMLHKDTTNVEIHAPKFGSGLAGGNWDFISLLIQDIWSDTNISIYTLKQIRNRK